MLVLQRTLIYIKTAKDLLILTAYFFVTSRDMRVGHHGKMLLNECLLIVSKADVKKYAGI